MKILSRCLAVVTSLFATGILPQSEPPDKYQTLLTRLKQGDMTVDFLELRRAYADSPEYLNGSDLEGRKAMLQAFNQGDFAQALERSKKILEGCYLDIEAHHIAALASREMHVQEEAEFHDKIAHRLIGAIFQSGNGKTLETAWEVIDTHEEYIVLQVLGYQPSQQSLLRAGEHSYDKLDAVDPKTQQRVTFFFNVDKTMARLTKIFSK